MKVTKMVEMMLNKKGWLSIAFGLAFLFSPQASYAETQDISNPGAADEPTAEDLKKSNDRSLHFTKTTGHGVGAKGGSVAPATDTKTVKQKIEKKSTTGVNSPVKYKRPIVRRVPTRKPVNISPKKYVQKMILPASQQTELLPGTDSGLVVKARLDKDGLMPEYKVGEKMQLKVTANHDCNIVVMDYDTAGQLTQLFPNDYQTNSFLKAGDTIAIGGPQSPFEYEVTGTSGEEQIFIYAYPASSDSPLAVAFNAVPNSPFRSAEMSLEEYKNLVNRSKVFFSRAVKVVPKSGTKLVSNPETQHAPNKIQLSFIIQK